jgi:hypothetical protein
MNETINSLKPGNEAQAPELMSLRNRFRDDLIQNCEKSDSAFFANCAPFFTTAYLVLHENRYLDLLGKAMSEMKPVPKSYDRMRFESMLSVGTVDLKFVGNWLETNTYFLSPEYRILHLVGMCLLGSSRSKVAASDYLEKRLLTTEELEKFMSGNLAPAIRVQVENCLE